MRTRPIGSVAALIVAIALVALAGPAASRTTGPARDPEPGAFTPFVLDDLTASSAISPFTIHVPASTASSLEGRALVESGVAPVPTRPPTRPQPVVRATAVVKAPVWGTAGYSWYGPGFYGNGTACGQTMTRELVGVAHRSLPCGTKITFRNPDNGRTITVRVVDRGPYVGGRLWDLTRGACTALDACYTGRIQWRLP